MPTEAPCLELLFVERESVELRALQQSVSGAAGALLMLSSTAQASAMLESAFREGRGPELLLVDGGLSDGRADQLLALARSQPAFASLRAVVFIDSPGARRRAFKPLSKESVAPGSWLLAKFL